MKAELLGFEVALERFLFSLRIQFIALQFFHEPRNVKKEPRSKESGNQQRAAEAILRTPRHHLFVSRDGDIWIGCNWNRPVHKKLHSDDVDPTFSFSLAVGSDPTLLGRALTEKCMRTCAEIVARLETRFDRAEIRRVEPAARSDGSPAASFESSVTEIRNQAANSRASHVENISDSLCRKIPFERDALEIEERAEYILAFLLQNA